MLLICAGRRLPRSAVKTWIRGFVAATHPTDRRCVGVTVWEGWRTVSAASYGDNETANGSARPYSLKKQHFLSHEGVAATCNSLVHHCSHVENVYPGAYLMCYE